MSVEKVKAYLARFGVENQVIEKEQSSATVELAAQALGVEPARIAKSLTFNNDERVILIVMAGDCKTDNKKFRDTFGFKPRMLKLEEVEEKVGYAAGGVCPFGVNEGVDVYLDRSLERFETVFPAAGSGNSMIELSLEQLSQYGCAKGSVDVSK